MAKFWPSQNFPGIYTMIFSKKTTRVVSIPKDIKINSGVWKIYLIVINFRGIKFSRELIFAGINFGE